MKPTTASQNFFDAFEAFKKSTPAERPALDKKLDKAMADYRKAHKLCDAYGFADLIIHFNTTQTK